ncbi:MAG: rhomboid family intramembrane serine protease [Opitutaceae bacterium]
MKITYNAPISLTFFIVALICMLLESSNVASLRTNLAVYGDFGFSSRYWIGVLGHSFIHMDWSHFLGNFSMFLLIAPGLEKKYTSRVFAVYLLSAAIIVGVGHTLLSNGAAVGASGLVFFCISLTAMAEFKKGELPLTTLLVVLLFFSKEVFNSFGDDRISQLAHILGGVCGIVIGSLSTGIERQEKLNQ